MRDAVARLKALEAELGCDHRAVFATTYRVLTEELLRTVEHDPGYLDFPRYFFFEDALFADVYIATGRAWNNGRRVSPAWQIAFETARSGDVTASQDMLLGINGHVQNDMAFVIAALGTRTRNGTPRKMDHDRFNEVLARAYQAVVDEVERRYDPSVGLTNPDLVTLEDYAGLELVKGWREQVWRNANRLIDAPDAEARARIAEEIEQNAANWAGEFAALPTPGYRAQRDAYCASHNPDA